MVNRYLVFFSVESRSKQLRVSLRLGTRFGDKRTKEEDLGTAYDVIFPSDVSEL
jgi:hypothetical protein